MPRGKLPSPENETGADKFRRLANARANKAISAIQSIGKLVGTNYEKQPDQVHKLHAALTAEADKMRDRLLATHGTAKVPSRDII